MPGTTHYLLIYRDDGLCDVFPLSPDTRYTVGRAPTNRIVLKDDLCSREHAEFFARNGVWYLRDNGSLNGTRLNNVEVKSEVPLEPHDEVRLGRTRMLYVEDMDQVPTPDAPGRGDETMAIRQRLTDTRYLQGPGDHATTVQGRVNSAAAAQLPARSTPTNRPTGPRVEQHVALLYRLALETGSTDDPEQLTQLALDTLLEAVPAEVGAVLTGREPRELQLVAYRHRDPNVKTYHKVSQFLSTEVMSTRTAILAEDVGTHIDLKNRDSLAELKVSGVICAPVVCGDQLLGLIHLYSTRSSQPLSGDDLEFAVAVAKQLAVALDHRRREERLSAENKSLRDLLRVESELVGESKPIRDIESQIARVAGTNATVLIRGESGSGKELVARAIHYSSPRREGPFICLNCAALTETLLESELFGHEKGAFTGATEKMIGKFEAADKGTIFLDEIGEMTVGTQAKLLRVLEGHPFERVGGNTPIKVDVRVVSATNQPLERAVQEGRFRKDLFYRLQVVEIRVPPLRERIADVTILAEHFLKRFVRETGRKISGFTPQALEKLKAYSWPGNVRELRNTVERSVALGTGPKLDVDDIWLSSLELDAPSASGRYEELPLSEVEKRHIAATLRHTDWNKSQAAAILGIERSTLDRKIKTYDIQK